MAGLSLAVALVAAVAALGLGHEATPAVTASGVAPVTHIARTSGRISGASRAACSPSPCSRGSDSAYTLTRVGNGDGTASTRAYAVYRPAHLTPSAGNLAPAILVFASAGSCGFVPSGRFASLAPADRFIVVYMEIPCARGNNWEKQNVDSATPTFPNDEPYVAAVVHAITQCPTRGAGAPNQCVDPQRIYSAGVSSGGNMTADIMCNVHNSSLFRGYLIDSSSLAVYGRSPNCPSSNRDYFVMLVLSNDGPDAGLYYDTTSGAHLDVRAFAGWAARRLACHGPRIDDAIGSPVPSTLRYTRFGPCAFAAKGSRAVVALGVQNGAHGWGCQDSDRGATSNACPGMPNPPGLGPTGIPQTNGLFVEGEFWKLVARGVSVS